MGNRQKIQGSQNYIPGQNMKDPLQELEKHCRIVRNYEKSMEDPLFGSMFIEFRDNALTSVATLMSMTDFILDSELSIYLADPSRSIRNVARQILNRRMKIRDKNNEGLRDKF